MIGRFLALVRKEVTQIIRDRRTLVLILIQPVLMLLLFGYALNTNVQHVPTAILDQADDRTSRDFVHALINSGEFEVVDTPHDPDAVRSAIDRGTAKVGVIIPPNFADLLASGRDAPVQMLIDGSDPNVAQTALSSASAIGQVRSALVLAQWEQSRGYGGAGPSIDVRPVVLYNPSMASVAFMVPGLIGVILQNITINLTAFAVVRERENGTLEQLLVSPIRRGEFMLGKMLPYLLIAFCDMALALTVGASWFHVPIAGNLALLLGLSLLFAMSSLSFGLLVSTVSHTQREAMQTSTIIILPSFMLAGFMFSRDAMPPLLHDVGYVLPLTYFLEILRGIITKGVGLDALWGDVVPLTIMGICLLTVSSWYFRKRLD